jgi:hypothetical protein
VRIRVVGFIVAIVALAASAGSAGAATVSGSLQVTATDATTVTFNASAQRTCAPDEQCDYYADLENFLGGGDCPTTYPADPFNAWNGNVQNTGPTTEVGMITPRAWTGAADPGPERLCLYIFADSVYYYVGGTVINRPAGAPPAGARTIPPGGITLPGGGRTGGGSTTPGGGTTGGASTRTPTSSRTVAVRTVALTQAAASAKAALKRAYGKRFTQGRRYRASCRRVGTSRIHVRCTVSWQRAGTWRGTVDVTGAVRGGRQVLVTRVRVRKPKA